MNDASFPPELALGNQLCFAVHSAAHAFAQAYKPLLEPLNLTYPQYLVMLLLWEKDNRSVSELGLPLFLDSGTLTPLLKRLQASGYISRARDISDERITRIVLTPEGRALQEKASKIPAAMLCITGLEPKQIDMLHEGMKQLGQALRKAG